MRIGHDDADVVFDKIPVRQFNSHANTDVDGERLGNDIRVNDIDADSDADCDDDVVNDYIQYSVILGDEHNVSNTHGDGNFNGYFILDEELVELGDKHGVAIVDRELFGYEFRDCELDKNANSLCVSVIDEDVIGHSVAFSDEHENADADKYVVVIRELVFIWMLDDLNDDVAVTDDDCGVDVHCKRVKVLFEYSDVDCIVHGDCV